MNRLQLKDRKIFESFFAKKAHSLSSFSFANIFIWKDFFDFFWVVIEGNLCIFAKNNIGCFMYLPPLGAKVTAQVIERCFAIMDQENADKNISRIENIEEDCVGDLRKLGLLLKPKDSEYLYQNKKLINLCGNSFKPKRAAYNYFVKNYGYEVREFAPKFKIECLKLFKSWSNSRKNKYQDSIYQSMLDDNLKVHRLCFDYCQKLGLTGIVVRVENKVRAYSFGFPLNKDTFCILLEVADLSFKGLAQFIFREFAAKMKHYKFINAMDDSGLKNLRKAKLSYRPCKLILSFIATRNQC